MTAFAKTLAARLILALAVIVTSGLALAESGASQDQQYPDVVDAQVTPRGDDRFDFDVTVSSPYDSAERYADAFRVMGPDETVFGVRELLHHHAGEQPFTRRLGGVAIPAEVREVVVQARDQTHGYGGDTLTVALPGR